MNKLIVTALMGALLAAAPMYASADDDDGLAGGVVGGVIGGLLGSSLASPYSTRYYSYTERPVVVQRFGPPRVVVRYYDPPRRWHRDRDWHHDHRWRRDGGWGEHRRGGDWDDD